jgi:hypothetical protein
MSQSIAETEPPVSLTGRFSSIACRAVSMAGSSLAISARCSGVQVDGRWPKATRSSLESATDVRARIWRSEPVARVSIGTMRPPLCTGISPSSRVFQPASAASEVAETKPRARTAAVLAARPRRKRSSEKPKCQKSPSDITATET